MARIKEVIILTLAGSMELCWLYGLAFFFLYLLGVGQFPPAGGFFAFWVAALLGFCAHGRGWMIIHVLMLQLAGFILVLSVVVYACGNWSAPFFSMKWLAEAGAELRDPMRGLFLFLLTFFTVLFWFGGSRFSRRRTAYSTITSRFDLGVAVFFFLFLFGGGMGERVPNMHFFLFPFFLFSMLSIALARSRGSGKKCYLISFEKIGLVFLVSIAVLLFAAGVVLLFLPGMSLLAETGYAFGKQLSAPLLSFLLKILFFLFGRRSLRQDSAGAGESGSGLLAAEVITEHEVQLWERIFTLGIFVPLGVGVVVAACWGCYHLYCWLFSRTSYYKKGYFLWQSLFFRFVFLWQRIRNKLLTKLFSPPEQGEGTRKYKKLLLWGKSGGFSRRPSETPREYGAHLGKYFPLLREEILLIIEGYNDEVYGELQLSGVQENRIKLAWHRLASPLHWPARLKTRLYSAGESQE